MKSSLESARIEEENSPKVMVDSIHLLQKLQELDQDPRILRLFIDHGWSADQIPVPIELVRELGLPFVGHKSDPVNNFEKKERSRPVVVPDRGEKRRVGVPKDIGKPLGSIGYRGSSNRARFIQSLNSTPSSLDDDNLPVSTQEVRDKIGVPFGRITTNAKTQAVLERMRARTAAINNKRKKEE